MARNDPVRYVSTFRAPSEYERQLEEARRRAALAEALAQQQYEPQEGVVAPIPRAAPLVKALQGFMTARAGRKAKEAEEAAEGMKEDYAQRMLGRMEGGYVYPGADPALAEPMAKRPDETLEEYTQRMQATPFTRTPTPTPEQTELGEVTRQSQYVRSPEEALAMASTKLGADALKDRPIMAARLAKMLETPETEEFYAPVVGAEGKYVQFGKRGGTRASDVAAPAPSPAAVTTATIMKDGKPTVIDARTGKVIGEGVPQRPPSEPLVSIAGPDGKPVFVRRSEAEGKAPYTAPPRMTANVVTDIAKGKRAIAEFDNASKTTQGFIDDITEGKLNLYKGAGLVYSGQRAFGGDETFEEGEEPDYVRYYALQRFVTQQVNRILNLAKGPQTDRDADRAARQILDNPDNEKVVVSALKRLKEIWEEESGLNKTYINALRTEFGQEPEFVDEDDDIIDLPPR